jgi:hypothetical protein
MEQNNELINYVKLTEDDYFNLLINCIEMEDDNIFKEYIYNVSKLNFKFNINFSKSNLTLFGAVISKLDQLNVNAKYDNENDEYKYIKILNSYYNILHIIINYDKFDIDKLIFYHHNKFLLLLFTINDIINKKKWITDPETNVGICEPTYLSKVMIDKFDNGYKFINLCLQKTDLYKKYENNGNLLQHCFILNNSIEDYTHSLTLIYCLKKRYNIHNYPINIEENILCYEKNDRLVNKKEIYIILGQFIDYINEKIFKENLIIILSAQKYDENSMFYYFPLDLIKVIFKMLHFIR